jgi:Gpi18-like mannosyltransferase
MSVFRAWFASIAPLPLGDVYARIPSLSYPPMIVVLDKLEALVFARFAPGALDAHALNYAVKLPAIVADCAGAALIYRLIRREAAHAAALAGAALIALNPAIIYDSAFWGQNDAIPTVLAVVALYELRYGSAVAAWLVMTAALFFKSPVLVLVPLMLIDPLCSPPAQRAARLRDCGAGILAAAVCTEILAVTFFAAPSPALALRNLAL